MCTILTEDYINLSAKRDARAGEWGSGWNPSMAVQQRSRYRGRTLLLLIIIRLTNYFGLLDLLWWPSAFLPGLYYNSNRMLIMSIIKIITQWEDLGRKKNHPAKKRGINNSVLLKCKSICGLVLPSSVSRMKMGRPRQSPSHQERIDSVIIILKLIPMCTYKILYP